MNREQRLRSFETNYGRDLGWLVEHSGRVWATLTEPREEDMFWVSYTITPQREEDAEVVLCKEFWARVDLCFRNRGFGEVAPNAFAASSAAPSREHPRVSMRGLYLWCSEPTRVERFLLWWRRRNNR